VVVCVGFSPGNNGPVFIKLGMNGIFPQTTAAVLLLLIVLKLKVRRLGGLQRRYVDTKFNKNRSPDSEV
jgi:hypothetical protein